MNIPLGEKLAFQQARNAVGVAFLVGILLSAIQITFDYLEKRVALKSSLDTLIESNVKSATESAWNLDEGLAQSVVKGLFTYANTVFASIESEKHEVLFSSERSLRQEPFRSLVTALFGDGVRQDIALTIEKNRARKVIGYLVVVADPYSEGIDFIRRSSMIFLSDVVRSLLLALILFAVFYRSMTRPIVEMANSLDNVDLSDIREGLSREQYYPSGEMRLLADKLNQLLTAVNKGVEIKDLIQQEINHKNIDLELKVRERTAQLRMEKERADKANKTKSLFLANISSALRTPLTAIVGLGEVARNTQDVEKLRSYFESVRGAATTVVSMIDDIVDLSQMEVNKLRLDESRFSIQSIQKDLKSIFNNEFEASGVDFQIYVDPMLPRELIGDVGRIKQVLINLISHSMKRVSNGYIHLHADLVQELASEHLVLVQIKVSYSGTALSPDAMGLMDDSYYSKESLGDDLREKDLNLVISRRIVELMGGELKVETEGSQSSAMTFQLSFQVPINDNYSMAQEQRLLESVMDDLSQRRVLVVEDIELNRMIVGEMLNEIGVKYDYAFNGEEAIQKVQENEFDLVLMDLQMPVLDGFDTTMAIRHQLGMTMLPIVALTANVLQEDKERSLRCGMNDFIGKPVEFEELSEKVLFWVSRSPVSRTEQGRSALEQ